ncbi:MAG: 23S rRNA (adenine(2503)-C(2))-methyltransferase RlmN [Holosporales bacterium]|nr:23S rRNA (adenine(2503)-C(2))-methyltransferase RlmN [Holosporales bacterium]
MQYESHIRCIFDLTLPALTAFLKDNGVEKFRANQIWNWLYVQGQFDFNQMVNLPSSLRDFLQDQLSCELPRLIKELTSADGTKKWLFETPDSKSFETVFIPDKARGTLCVSSQIGCFVGCKFCRTGAQGFERNLTSGEIVGQALFVKKILSEWPTNPHNKKITNLVFMGMGEPLFNYNSVCTAISVLTHQEGLAFSRHGITVSTSGITDKILPLAQDTGVNLAISLHSADEDKRSRLMPINQTFRLAELLVAVKKYPGASRTERVTFEYIMLKDFNDSEADALLLARAIKGVRAKVNLIPFNPWKGSDLKPSSPNVIQSFAKILRKAGYICTIRDSRGRDIMAACGQLKSV